ncbi:MAG: alpha-amylase family glycosyl hydrolase [Solirubrobacteraceae bacterium]
MSEPVALRATYRLQLGASFGFDAARARIPYLRDLGISHLYLSPSLAARAGSAHGYDVIDPTHVSDGLGGEDALRALADAAHAAGMGIVLDLVGNHMAADDANPLWADDALRARFFDIDPLTGRHRRFFDIDDLAGVRQEDPSVFEHTHRLVLSLVSDGVLDGLRIDHIDGLADPAGYLARLRDGGVAHVWVEKILADGERLRDWPVAGTVGYEFLNDCCGLFVDGRAEARFTSLWETVSGDPRPFSAVAREATLEQATSTFAAEVQRLAGIWEGAGGEDELTRAVASLPIYRTYVEPVTGLVTDADRAAVAAAEISPELSGALLLERAAGESGELVTRFQQTTPAVYAKGVEDTAFYRYGRLLALCEVGGEPGRFGIDARRFHDGALERARRFPETLLATATHDTKRSADVRARIAALTWIGDEWERGVRAWMAATEPLRRGGAPDDAERYVLLQTLVGAWPLACERLERYALKALREAKRNTSWVDVDEPWEAAVVDFCRALYGSASEPRRVVEELVARAAPLGERIALGMVALKLTAPGVPDIYQGDELELRALVDPDNRGAVDWELREALARRLAGGARVGGDEFETRKLWLTRRLLGLRIRRPAALGPGGSYEPLDAGAAAVAYLRGGEVLVCVATRPGLEPRGSLLRGARGRWRDLLNGDERELGSEAPLAELLGGHGIAVLEHSR